MILNMKTGLYIKIHFNYKIKYKFILKDHLIKNIDNNNK